MPYTYFIVVTEANSGVKVRVRVRQIVCWAENPHEDQPGRSWMQLTAEILQLEETVDDLDRLIGSLT